MGKEFEPIDSAWLESGKFHFEDEKIVPGMYMLRIPKINKYQAIAIDKEPISLKVGEDSIQTTGGESQDQLNTHDDLQCDQHHAACRSSDPGA